jgi:GGDEF domain-containing protein
MVMAAYPAAQVPNSTQQNAALRSILPPGNQLQIDSAAQPGTSEVTPPQPQPGPSEATVPHQYTHLRQGELASFRIEELLESCAAGKLTGLLEIRHDSGTSKIFFEKGAPIHAVHGECLGDVAITEMIDLKEGSFTFHVDKMPEQRTVLKGIEGLLLAHAALINYSNYLKEHRLRDDSPLIRLCPDLSEPDFESLLAAAAPVDIQLQKRIYLAIDGKSTLSDILRLYPLPRSQWVPIIFNLVCCQLVAIIDVPKHPHVPISTADMELNRHLLTTVRKRIIVNQTGLYAYPTLLLFLEQELNRYLACQRPFSLVLMKMTYRDVDPEDILMQEAALKALSDPIKRINEVKRRSDIFCHYKLSDYALLLPETDSKTAHQQMSRVYERVKNCSLAPGSAHQLTMEAGLASVPEQCDSMETILGLAETYQKIF